jgi:DNA primase
VTATDNDIRSGSGTWRDRLEDAKQRYPLADVLAASGMELRRGGPGTFWARCPFHADKTPSFFVDLRKPDRPHWYCFGCKLRGDVLDFVQRRDGLGSAGEALDHLVGAPPPPRARVQATGVAQAAMAERRWDHLTLEEQLVLNATLVLYQHTLWRSPQTLGYLRGRGLPDWVIRTCGLGYADGHSLERYLRQRGGLRLAESLGLLRRPEQGEGAQALRERFAGRIVVPELRGGQPIWFIGRRPDELGRAKYVALPGERPVLGLERARGRRQAFLVEGVFDWLTDVAWGLPAFSPCGTGLPPNRLGWLARARVVWGALDADRGGREGAERFAAALGRRFHPLTLPEGRDLNDLGRQSDGRATFFRLLREARRDLRDQGGPIDAASSPSRGTDVNRDEAGAG